MNSPQDPSAARVAGTASHVAPVASTRAGKYLMFFLDGEEYGVEILKVSEIIGMQAITRVPRMPTFVRGVINLRGKVIPITDLRSKFGIATDSVAESCIVVVQVKQMQLGVVVDRVSEVLALAENEIDDAPQFGAGVRTEFLRGVGKSGNRVRLLLDIDRVLDRGEIDALSGAQMHAA